MRKFFIFGAIALFANCIISCSSCKNEEEENVNTEVIAESINVEKVIKFDKEYMFMNYQKEDYRWFEACVLLEDYLDSEECDGTVSGVSDIYQVVTERAKGYDTQVILFSHKTDTTTIDVKDAFFVGDFPLNEENIILTFEEAFEKVMETNAPKPHSRQVVLRKEIGPKVCNPQYIFGNKKAQLYVDAVTGEVSDINPAFGDLYVGKPLGEWP